VTTVRRKLRATEIHPKVAASGIAGGGAFVLIVIAKRLGLDLSADEAAAGIWLVTFVAGYLKSSKGIG
jgi:hypothetical protein